MNELLEKIKSLDKKILIGVGVAVAVVIILVVALVIGFGNNKGAANKGDSQNNTQYGTETEDGTTEVLGTEDATEELGTEMTTETEVATESSEMTSEGGQSQTGTVNPDGEGILGAGNTNDPYLEILGNDYTVTTVSVAPGSTVYYGIYRVGGMYLTINDANAYVIYEGKRYDATNGKVSLKVKNELASEAVYFEIGNKGNTATSFTLKFSNLTGSYANPENISSMGTYTKSLAKGNETGHYYKYVAEKSGSIRFYIDAATKDSEMSVTNNNASINRTFEADALTDANGKTYIEVPVTQGDVLMIQICVKPDKRWNYPATDITWSGIYQ